MSFEFERCAATPRLAPFLDSLWWARGRIEYAREQIAPTGATVVVINLGDVIYHETFGARASGIEAETGWITGPHDRPSLNEPRGETHCYGIVTRPVGCESLLGIDPRTLRGSVEPLVRWSAGLSLRDRLRDVSTERGFEILLESLESDLADAPRGFERIQQAVVWLEDDPRVGVSTVADRLGISHAYLDREFSRITGLSPRRLAAILRVRRLLEEIDVAAEQDWVDLAVRHGWYDQSHMIRDFKRYTGVSPEAYLEAQRAHLAPSEFGDASGFVPEGHRSDVKSIQDEPVDSREAGPRR